MIQGGCPEGSRVAAVPATASTTSRYRASTRSARSRWRTPGPDTNGSQFFVCIDDCTRKLTKNYNLFGYVIEGIDVAQSIQVGDVMQSVTIEERPKG